MRKNKCFATDFISNEVTLPVLPNGYDVIYTEDIHLINKALENGYCTSLVYKRGTIKVFALFKIP